MNETQQEPDTDAEPTYHTLMQRQISEGGDVQLVEDTVEGAEVAVVCPEYADLLGTVGGAAEEIKEMGYDPVAAVEALPELLEALESIAVEGKKSFPDAESMIRWTLDALDRAEGSDQ